jgi:hypothetical protein
MQPMTSERTMNQVRAILNKLDRSIDEARERRTHPEPAPIQPTAPRAEKAAPGSMATPVLPAATAAPVRETSPFGRAQPLNRPQNTPSWRL